MRFMVMVMSPGSSESPSAPLPDPKEFEKMDLFTEELVRAGSLIGYNGLKQTVHGARMAFTGGPATVTDGPFTEAKELVAGYMVLKVKSKEEAIALMKRAPFGKGTVLELRELHEMDDFGPLDPTGEMRAKEIELQKIMAANAK